MINGSIYEGHPFKIIFISVLQIMFFVFFQLRKFDWPWGQKYIKDTGWLMDQFIFISVLQIMFFVFFQLQKFDWPWGQKYIKGTGWLMD